MDKGKLYAIGVGPGDPELLTLKAKRILEAVDYLFIPVSREDKRSIAFSIITKVVKKDWKIIEVLVPMTNDLVILQESWDETAKKISEVLDQGRDCAYITLGDPGTYSSFSYIHKSLVALMPNLKVEIIPGITSYQAISAWVNKPLVEGQENLTIVPAVQNREKISTQLDNFDNIVFLKAGKKYREIDEILKQKGISARLTLASRFGFEDGFYTEDLNELNGKELDYLTSLLVKK
ncbi:Cobalt-precorrin-2 C20-methyltransferase [Candidatus Syntrophocurvum alkaliphilum]|uniref:Cobalt-precorrin-2 C20-methyltransferase n=1 Tax=Candidatus Syntrophocurvum alkaliphilum TaxID=2293317 RepID=A0A6I6DJG9_9FIRM|nr:precorrin-2 C(20)-methyltransferase [Candidatus Syntrophocurvum alkaliphilum]QGU00251.1 Cobalt-precorrin-2 C20-methyltransferase [Candidatus Syntrophocurvum alkaliphilum]